MTQERDYTQGGALDRDALILDHVPLLHHIVGRMSWDVAGYVDRDDLLGWGMLGLIAAADTWDPARGLRFSTFAYPKVRGAILDELRRMDFLPRGRRENGKRRLPATPAHPGSPNSDGTRRHPAAPLPFQETEAPEPPIPNPGSKPIRDRRPGSFPTTGQ